MSASGSHLADFASRDDHGIAPGFPDEGHVICPWMRLVAAAWRAHEPTSSMSRLAVKDLVVWRRPARRLPRFT